MSDKNCYVCQMDTLKNYICKDCYFLLLRKKEELEKQNESLISLIRYITMEDWDSDYVCKELESIGINTEVLFEM